MQLFVLEKKDVSGLWYHIARSIGSEKGNANVCRVKCEVGALGACTEAGPGSYCN